MCHMPYDARSLTWVYETIDWFDMNPFEMGITITLLSISAMFYVLLIFRLMLIVGVKCIEHNFFRTKNFNLERNIKPN